MFKFLDFKHSSGLPAPGSLPLPRHNCRCRTCRVLSPATFHSPVQTPSGRPQRSFRSQCRDLHQLPAFFPSALPPHIRVLEELPRLLKDCLRLSVLHCEEIDFKDRPLSGLRLNGNKPLMPLDDGITDCKTKSQASLAIGVLG